jgi:starch synthase
MPKGINQDNTSIGESSILNARVLIVTSEAVPLIKTGGLADVISSLAHRLQMIGIDATVMMPAYPAALAQAKDLHAADKLDMLPGGAGQLWLGKMPDTDVPVILLKTEGFDRRTANPYVDNDGGEYEDNALCFGALAHAAARICAGETTLPKPHVVHANDWHAALIPALLRLKDVKDVGTVLTIHNLAFQGNFPMSCAAALGIPDSICTPDAFEYWGKLSFMKGGIKYADRITTVSRSYAREILTPRFGHGMDGILNTRKDDLVAIPNGVDTQVWDPENDALIAHHFTSADMHGKISCKRELQQLFGLPVDPFAPILGLGSRITHQKMADVALIALPDILQRYPRAQVIIIGCGDHQYEQGFKKLAEQFPMRVGVYTGYDEQRAHALHAGADMLLHGSRFEPFGLTPLYSMRYGTIPIASRVGGMIDSITDAGLRGPISEAASGILFDGEEPTAMVAAVSRAFEIHNRTDEWQAMQRNAMSADFSWSVSGNMYVELYQTVAPEPVKPYFTVSPLKIHSESPQLVTVICHKAHGEPENDISAEPVKKKKTKGGTMTLPINSSSMLVR